MSDVVVKAPPAVIRVASSLETVVRATPPPTPAEMLEMALAENRSLHQQLHETTMAARTICNVACSLARSLMDREQVAELVVPRELSDRMEGASITVGEIPITGDVIVRIRERIDEPRWETV